MSQIDHEYDVIVMGAGPAGATAAALIAREGHRTLVIDRDVFPRAHVGESLMPATYWTLQRLGVLDRMQRTPFPRKHSVQFFSKSGRSSTPFYFSEFDPHVSSVTWQVDRAAFDKLLLDNAVESGAEAWMQTNVRDLILEGSRVAGVVAERADGSRPRIGAKAVVDATGQTALIARRLGLKNPDPVLRHAAVYTRYRGARREPGIDEGATLILQTGRPKCWFWYIPLPDDHVSVGVVGPIESLIVGREGGPRQIYDEEVAQCPALEERIAGAERVTEIEVVRDFSYISTRIAGDGWVMAGDAFGFLDPIYSSGVFLALKSAEFAADSVLDAFRHGDFTGAVLGQHGGRYLEGMEAMRKLVYAYYDESFHVAEFVKQHPRCREPIVNLLIGNVYRRPLDGLFEAMARHTELPEARRLESDETVH